VRVSITPAGLSIQARMPASQGVGPRPAESKRSIDPLMAPLDENAGPVSPVRRRWLPLQAPVAHGVSWPSPARAPGSELASPAAISQRSPVVKPMSQVEWLTLVRMAMTWRAYVPLPARSTWNRATRRSGPSRRRGSCRRTGPPRRRGCSPGAGRTDRQPPAAPR
jgi:hypothetical protein